MSKTFYITTAIHYLNGPPHIGHAYEAVTTDVLARFKRLDGYEVRFLTGVDDHGQKMVKTATEMGLPPHVLADRMAPEFEKMNAGLAISNDDFIRTTQARHKKAVQTLWKKIAANGDIYLDTYAGWYSVRDEAYYGAEEISDGPDGIKLAPTGAPVEWIEEESYFFRLSAYKDRLLALYDSVSGFIQPESRKNEVRAFVEKGLHDLSISRTRIDWGIPVPGNPAHVIYVWVDALTNYITGAGYPNMESAQFRKFWPADIHIIGKDIARFHAIIWPALLMSANIPVPGKIFGHGFLLNKGEKMSKSVGNVIGPLDLAETYGVDQIRYFFCRAFPYGQDGNYNHETLVARINADLANDLGNLAQRSLSMIASTLDGRIQAPGDLTEADRELLDKAAAMLPACRSHMDNQQIHHAVSTIWDVVARTNRYFAGQEPWVLKKQDTTRMGTVLYVTAEVIRQIAILAQPVMPDAASRLLDALGVAPEARNFPDLTESPLVSGNILSKPEPVFPRHVEKEAP